MKAAKRIMKKLVVMLIAVAMVAETVPVSAMASVVEDISADEILITNDEAEVVDADALTEDALVDSGEEADTCNDVREFENSVDENVTEITADTFDENESDGIEDAILDEENINADKAGTYYPEWGGKYKTQDNTMFGTLEMTDPRIPQYDTDEWHGSYVFYGKYENGSSTYNGKPVVYRVLDRETTEYSKDNTKTMLLDCDHVYLSGVQSSVDATYFSWQGSNARKELNDSKFLNNGGLSAIEKNAIAESYKAKPTEGKESNDYTAGESFAALTGEKVFLLDYSEMRRTTYGYPDNDNESKTRLKYAYKYPLRDANSNPYWVRSNVTKITINAKVVGHKGGFSHNPVNSLYWSPAFNIDLSKVMFSSAMKGEKGNADTMYKLTLIDDNMKAGIASGKKVTVQGSHVTVPYTVSGANSSDINAVTVLILDGAYNTKAGNSNTANILYYGILDTDGDFSKSGTGTFTLPSDLDPSKWGSEYRVYILAEQTDRELYTDYAGTPVEIPKSSIEIKKIEKYNLWVGDVQVDEINKSDILEDRRAIYDLSTNTLTLKSANIKKTHTGKNGKTSGISAENMSLTIKGAATINVPDADFAILATDSTGATDKVLTIDGDITTNGSRFGIIVGAMDLNFNSGTVRIREAKESAVEAEFGGKIKFGDGMKILSPEKATIKTKTAENGISKYTRIYESDQTTVVKTVTIGKNTSDNYDLWVGGIQVTEDNKSDILEDGKASYDPSTGTLTFNNAVISDGYEYATGSKAGIYSENIALTIKGDVTIEGSAITNGIRCEDLGESDRLLTLDANIKIKAEKNGIITQNKQLKIGSGTVDVEITGSKGVPINAFGEVILGTGVKVISPEGAVIKKEGVYSCVYESETSTIMVKDAVIGDGKTVTSYTVSFNLNGKTGTAPDSQTVKKGEKATEPAIEPKADGVAFGGWYTEAACTNRFDFSTPINQDYILYAKWVEGTLHTVTFNLNGKTGTAPTQQKIEDGKTVTRPADPSTAGASFTGWYTDAACKSAYDFSTPVKGDFTLYAGWEDAVTFTVSFDLNGKAATPVPTVQSVVKDEKAVRPADPKASGFTFNGWFTDAACKNPYDFASPVTNDLTLYAGWDEGEPIVIAEDELWNLYEDASPHEFTVDGINAAGSIENTNAKSKAFYEARLSGSTISVKLTGNRKNAAKPANTILEFNLGEDGVIEYVLPVTYVKPVFKLSSASATIKAGCGTRLRTRLLYKAPGGNFEPYDMTGVKVSGFDGIAVNADGFIELTTKAAAKNSISVEKDGWDLTNPVNLPYTVKAGAKDVLNVDLQGLKNVTVNTNAKAQTFEYDVTLNGEAATSATVEIEDKKGTELATITDTGKLVIKHPAKELKAGNYTITLKAKTGSAKADVKVKVSSKPLDQAIAVKVQSKFDVVTKQSMVVIPNLKEVGGTITAAAVKSPSDPGFSASINEAGNIVIDYTGTTYNVKNLKVGDMTLALTVDGISEPVNVTLKGVSAKKTTPTVKASPVTLPSTAKPADGKVIGTVNILSTYKDSSGMFKPVKPEDVAIIGVKNVVAKENSTDKTEIDISKLTGKSGSVTVQLTYPGGVTKKLTISVKSK